MNLEAIEQRCLAYLKQTAQPMVPLSTLERHLAQDEACEGISSSELLTFLEEHELFQVFPAMAATKEDEHELAALGVVNEPRVVLFSRVPDQRGLLVLMATELDNMLKALEGALLKVRAEKNQAMEDRLLDMLSRTEQLKKRIGAMVN